MGTGYKGVVCSVTILDDKTNYLSYDVKFRD